MSKKQQQMILPQVAKKAPFSIQAPGVEKKEGEGIPRRHPQATDGPIPFLEDDCLTSYDIVCRGAKKFGNAQALGSRKLVRMHEETKMIKKVVDGQETEVPKKWNYFEMSGYTYMSFIEYKSLVDTVGSGLRALGLGKDDRLQIFAATR